MLQYMYILVFPSTNNFLAVRNRKTYQNFNHNVRGITFGNSTSTTSKIPRIRFHSEGLFIFGSMYLYLYGILMMKMFL